MRIDRRALHALLAERLAVYGLRVVGEVDLDVADARHEPDLMHVRVRLALR